MSIDGRRILVIAAHPDDEVLGCGGTAARRAGEGHEVWIVLLGEGATSRHPTREETPSAEVEALRAAALRAAGLLGAKELFHYDLPDNRFDTVPLLDVIKLIEGHVDELRPHIVYTQHGGDLNVDHSVTFRATLAATRPLAGRAVAEVYAYEVASSTEWAFQSFHPVFRPNVFVDIARTLPDKIRAMQVYESEARPFPHPRSPEALRAAALRWGSAAGLRAAEAFQLVRRVEAA